MTTVFFKLNPRIRWYHISALFAVQTALTLVNRHRFLPSIEINLRGVQIFQRMTVGYSVREAEQLLGHLDLPARAQYLNIWLPLSLVCILVSCLVFASVFVKAWPRIAVYMMIPVCLYLTAGIGETALTLHFLRGGILREPVVSLCSFLTRVRFFLGDTVLYTLSMIAVAAMLIRFFGDRKRAREDR